MKEALYVTFGLISLTGLVLSILPALKIYKGKKRGDKVLSALHIFTFGVFISVVFIFVPVYYAGYDFGDAYAFIRPLLISVHHAFRVFVLGGEFDTIRDAVSDLSSPCHEMFSFYTAVLYVLAPVLTFGNVLSLFKNLKSEFRFAVHRKRPYYIFSELNERSLALAESVANSTAIKHPLIVFTDVFEQDDENEYELHLRARDLNAVLLKKNISRLNVKHKKSRVEFFLIGEDESENIDQAIKLTGINKGKRKVAVYVFSSRQISGYILDSLDKGTNIIGEGLQNQSDEYIRDVLYGKRTIFGDFKIDDGFYLRRIDSVGTLTLKVLSDKKIISPMSKAAEKTKKISLMIIGTGEYGKAFLKTALWLYQFYGYIVEITVIDKEEKCDIIGKIKKDCPDLKFDEEVTERGESNYHIRIRSGVDVNLSDLGTLFQSEEELEWIKRIQLAVVSLGDDDKNIETAVWLRKLFDVLNNSGTQGQARESEVEFPMIYSVVYNDKKATNLTSNNDGKGIKNHKEESYNINFVGSLKEQYSYSEIERLKTIEKAAIGYHMEWAGQIGRLRDIYENRKNGASKEVQKFRKQTKRIFEEQCKSKAEASGKEYVYEEKWGDEHLFGKDKDDKTDFNVILPGEVIKLIVGYMNYEYYRNSSIAKAFYKDVYACFNSGKSEADDHDGSPVCMCKSCENSRISEHMRWNAYMRTNGYKYGKKRSDRGQTHTDLVPWDELPYFERFKD